MPTHDSECPRTHREPRTIGEDVPTHREELDADVIQEALWGQPPGSGRAFARLYEHYETHVRYAVARAAHRTGHFHRVDELRQDVWARMLDKDRKLLRYYKPEAGPLGAFIARIAYQQGLHAALRERRQSGGNDRQVSVSPDWLEDEGASRFITDLAQGQVYRKLMERAAAELDELDRLVLREVHLNQRRCKDVALECGLKAEGLYKRNERLKKKLAAWGEQLLDGTDRPEDGMNASTVLVLLILAGLGAHPTIDTLGGM